MSANKTPENLPDNGHPFFGPLATSNYTACPDSSVGTPLSKRHPRLLMTPFSCSVSAFVTS